MPISSGVATTTTRRLTETTTEVKQSQQQSQQSQQHTIQRPVNNNNKGTGSPRSIQTYRPPPPRAPDSPTPECFRARNFFGSPGHHRYGLQPKRGYLQPGHYKYGINLAEPPGGGYNGPGSKTVALYPRGVPGEYASYNTWGPTRFGGYGWTGWTQGCCGPQTKSLRAVFIGLFAILAAAGLATGLYMYYEEPQIPWGPKGGREPFIRIYQVDGLYVPCQDRTTTGPPKPPTTTAEPTTPPPPTPLCITVTTTGVTVTTTTPKPTTTTTITPPTTTTTTPITTTSATRTTKTTNTATTTTGSPNTATTTSSTTPPPTTTTSQPPTTTTTTTQPPTTTTTTRPPTTTTTPVPTICFWITEEDTTTPFQTTTVPETTTSTPNTLPYCDDLTTSYSLMTIQPAASGSSRTGFTVSQTVAIWITVLSALWVIFD